MHLVEHLPSDHVNTFHGSHIEDNQQSDLITSELGTCVLPNTIIHLILLQINVQSERISRANDSEINTT